MKRSALLLAFVTVLGVLTFGLIGAASADSGDCYDGSNPTEVGTPGPVGVGYEADNDTGNSAFFQHVCYRVYNPVSGAKIAGGVIKPYQYYWPAPGSAA